MIDLTLQDHTQEAILPHLNVTEQLMACALEKENGHACNVEIAAMPDLGLANNSTRMRGGFYTGMFVKWDTDIPFVPIDATVNSCGVTVFLLNNIIEPQALFERIKEAKRKAEAVGYNWNFERGNHFITLCRDDFEKYYLVMHASADEYKKNIRGQALYPTDLVWYHDDIKVIFDNAKNRVLRYIVGKSADKFISVATGLEAINQNRMLYIADAIAGNDIKQELLYVPHYGMPSENSIAIGCSWKSQKSILLSVPGSDMYIVRNADDRVGDNIDDNVGADKKNWLMPHGFGAQITNPVIVYQGGELYINRMRITCDEDVALLKEKEIRCAKSDTNQVHYHVDKILEAMSARITNRLHPIAMVNKDGFVVY